MERDTNLTRKIGQAARTALGKVFEEWNSEADWAIKRATEAQIAAASLGYKALYWDPWGEASAPIRAQLRRVVIEGARVDATDPGAIPLPVG